MRKDKYASGASPDGNKAGYQSSGGKVAIGCGFKDKPCYSKSPKYDVYGKVESIKHGHSDVGEKI